MIALMGSVSCLLIVFNTSCVISELMVSQMCLTSEFATSCFTLSSSILVSRKVTAVIVFATFGSTFCLRVVANSVLTRVSSEVALPAIIHPLVWR